MRVSLADIKSKVQNSSDMIGYIDDIINNKCSPSDPPFLSDLIVGFKDGGSHVMQALEHRYHEDRDAPVESRLRWKLHVVRDEFGNVGLPGDIVEFKVQKKLEHSVGKPVTARELSIDKINGFYDKKWTRSYKYVVDNKGCIELEFMHAARFLNLWGVHSVSGAIISRHKQEHSGGPEATAKAGEKLHVWYWRYKEADKKYYEELPVLEPRHVQKRGEDARVVIKEIKTPVEKTQQNKNWFGKGDKQ